ncbi:MAG: DEAD/DEAH box helicase [Methanoregula sp.]|jgi:Fanconi anemia group M protein|uniref:DEAD/DEAH box helicase n=1 Tax=Methanoregula sp. TaxID=2052170 RepID=UPI0025E0E7CC|nr:DEAD/DEAH box helicase [Methanoregula sp.]MCK9630899.1 DEAD/DEAH box helicase [Methanoregula sp.]
MNFISHPLIKPDAIEKREYQLSIAMKALDGNTMVILPTGLGKTAVALLVAASRLYNEGGRVLMLAPTKPLVEQHLRYFEKYLLAKSPEGSDASPFVMFTGEAPPEERTADWNRATVILATPQVIKNDIIAGRYTLADVSLLIVDECHRAVGNYAYVFLAQRYLATADKPLLLAMTASPGGVQEKVQEVCANLGIEHVETRTENDADVRPYVFERELEYININLPPDLKAAIQTINALTDDRLAILASLHFTVPKREKLSMRELSAINAQIQQRIANRDSAAFSAASVYAELMKLKHAVTLAESQGSEVLKGYLAKLYAEGTGAGGSKASQRLVQDHSFRELFERSVEWTHELHPKPEVALGLVKQQLADSPDSRIIIFATYRDTVQLLVDYLAKHGIVSERFVGQATKDAEKGLSQKKQIAALTRFREGEFKVLVATSVGEEGLDVPSTDLVIFYEAVPSEIRSIQRKGRTGRSGAGRVVVLITKGTSDEVFRHVSTAKEKMMHKSMRTLNTVLSSPRETPIIADQASIEEFTPQGVKIVIDDRETSSKVVEVLSTMGAAIRLERLPHGDYAVGDRILIERKTSRDFADTLINRDLLGQLKEMADVAPRPVLIVEGADLYTQRDIHPNAIRGVLAAITIDMGISLIFTKDEQDTAQMLYVIAKREEGERGERKVHPHKSQRSLKEEQEYVVSAFPEIGLRNARLLLAHFGSVQAVVNASMEELVAVPGIGEKTAQKIFELCRRAYG